MAVSPTYQGGTNGGDYTPTTITELGGMIGKIAYSVIRENTAQDHLAVFDKMPINKGDTIEQAVVKMAESLSYDADGDDAGALRRWRHRSRDLRRPRPRAGAA